MTRLLPEDIIPLREMLGNYNELFNICLLDHIIPLREMLGNYNRGERLIHNL